MSSGSLIDSGVGSAEPEGNTPPSASSVEALASAAASFADTWHRWSGRQAIAAGANVTRLQLLHLVRCHGPQKMADLADSLDVTPRSVTALVDGLEGEGLVRRVAHATDRRVTLVELTCDRQRVADQMTAYQASLATLFTDMPDADRAEFLRLLTALRDRMAADAPGHGHRQEFHRD